MKQPTGPRNAFYAQSGGVTAVINASACGVIETARKHPRQHRQGLRRPQRHHRRADRGPDRHQQGDRPRTIAALRYTPAGAFGSCRYKLKGLEENRAQYERLIEVFRAHDIGYFFYNGGNDSADTCLKVSQLAEKLGYPLHGHPRAEDRRQRPADHRQLPGLRLGRQVRRGVDARGRVRRRLDGRDVDQGVRARGDGPPRRLDHRGRRPGRGRRRRDPAACCCSPRSRSTRRSSSPPSTRRSKQHGYCCVGVSEGLRNADGKFMAEPGTRDAFGHAQLGGVGPVIAQLVKDELGYKYHWAVADYLQRAARHIASKTDVEQAYAVGKAAVELALAGHNAVMPTIMRTSEQALPLEDRRGAARRGRQRREDAAARLHHRRTASASPPRRAPTSRR